MHKSLNIFTVLICFILFGCSSWDEPEQKTGSDFVYFNFEDWKNTQFLMFKDQNNVIIKKSVSTNKTQAETKYFPIQEFNWKEEFRIFEEASINRASYLGLYETIEVENKKTFVAQKQSLKIRSFQLTYIEDRVDAIEIVMKKENLLYASEYILKFESKKGYSITNNQILKILNIKSYYHIDGKFIFVQPNTQI
jgi:hypothetical protein